MTQIFFYTIVVVQINNAICLPTLHGQLWAAGKIKHSSLPGTTMQGSSLASIRKNVYRRFTFCHVTELNLCPLP